MNTRKNLSFMAISAVFALFAACKGGLKMKRTVFGLLIVSALFVSGLTGCLSTGPVTAEEYRTRGGEYYNKQDYQNALADYNRAIELDPTLARAYFNRGQVYYITSRTVDDLKKAISEFERALEIDPNFIRAASANAYIGASYYEIGMSSEGTEADFVNARHYTNKALVIEENNESALKIAALLDKRDEERAMAVARLTEIQGKIDTQFSRIDKSQYEEVIPTQQSLMMAAAGMGRSTYQVGKRYKTVVLTGMNTRSGATFSNSVQGFVDPDKSVPAEITTEIQGFWIYFLVNRISGNDHYITLEYIDLIGE